MGEKVGLCGVKLSSSYQMPLVIMKEIETESVIKGYHAYTNDWTPILGENISARPEPENEIDKHAVAVTKDVQKPRCNWARWFWQRGSDQRI